MMNTKVTFTILSLLLALLAWSPLPVVAQSDPAPASTALPPPGTGLDQVQRLAEQGNAAAQNRLGWMYDYGKGVAKDEKQAFAWYQKAADQGYAPAQFNLGVEYENGIAVPKDFAQALAWYQKAADQGHANAQYSVGYMHATGEGVPRDIDKGFQWFLKSAQ